MFFTYFLSMLLTVVGSLPGHSAHFVPATDSGGAPVSARTNGMTADDSGGAPV